MSRCGGAIDLLDWREIFENSKVDEVCCSQCAELDCEPSSFLSWEVLFWMVWTFAPSHSSICFTVKPDDNHESFNFESNVHE